MSATSGGMRLRLMGIVDILDETFSLYRRHFMTFVTAMAVMAVPVALLSTVVNVALGGASAVPVAIIAGLSHVLNAGAIIRVASDAVLGQSLDIGAAYRDALGRPWPLLWTSIAIGILVGLMVLTFIGIIFAIHRGLGWALALQRMGRGNRGRRPQGDAPGASGVRVGRPRSSAARLRAPTASLSAAERGEQEGRL